MSKEEPLLNYSDLLHMAFPGKPEEGNILRHDEYGMAIRDFYESARTKDTDLINAAKEALEKLRDMPTYAFISAERNRVADEVLKRINERNK